MADSDMWCEVLRCQQAAELPVTLPFGRTVADGAAEIAVCQEHHGQLTKGETYRLIMDDRRIWMGDDLRTEGLQVLTDWAWEQDYRDVLSTHPAGWVRLTLNTEAVGDGEALPPVQIVTTRAQLALLIESIQGIADAG